jgi:hypothetical protein
VLKLVVDTGRACTWYQDRVLHDLTCKRIQVDELWGIVHSKQKNVPTAKKVPANAGDVWLWVAKDADTKLVPSWYVGGRDSDSAMGATRSVRNTWRDSACSRFSRRSARISAPPIGCTLGVPFLIRRTAGDRARSPLDPTVVRTAPLS